MYRSISTVKADLAQAEFGLTGRGVVWAVVSTGIDGSHPHFQRFRNLDLPTPLHHMEYCEHRSKISESEHRAVYSGEIDIGDLLLDERFIVPAPFDPIGPGTGVAGIIAGQSNGPVYAGPMRGLAPEAKIISFRVLGEDGKGSEFDVLAALQAIQHINDGGANLLIHGVLIALSIGWDFRNFACGESPVCVEVNRLVNSGVVVVTASGNKGLDDNRNVVVAGTINDPGNAELGITVGATHRILPELYGASFFSSRGPTADGRRKPDLLAPGERIMVCNTTLKTPQLGQKARKKSGRSGLQQTATYEVPGQASEEAYWDRDGTDVAAAHVAGAAAALLSVQNHLIGKPKEVKDILLRTAVDLGRDPNYQGTGLLDVLAAVRHAVGTPKAQRSVVRPLRVFCSYSHKDKAFLEEFKAHLTPLERAGQIEVWFDGMLEAGQRWEAEIYRKLNAAEIILVLVSAYFFESEFGYSKELKRAVEREAEGTTRIIPIIVRPVTLKGTVLAEIQALPPEAKPITSFRPSHKGWAEVTEGLYDIVEKLRENRQ